MHTQSVLYVCAQIAWLCGGVWSTAAAGQTCKARTVTNAVNSTSALCPPLIATLHHFHSNNSSPFLSYAAITTSLIAVCIKSPPFVYLNVCNESHPFELVPHHPVWTLAGTLVAEKRQQLDVLVGGDLNTNYSWCVQVRVCICTHTQTLSEAMHKSMSLWVTEGRFGV